MAKDYEIRENLLTEITPILSNHTNYNSEFDEELHLAIDLNMTLLQESELIIELEDYFDITISDSQVDDVETVKDIIDLLLLLKS